jgi:hypothetical protein
MGIVLICPFLASAQRGHHISSPKLAGIPMVSYNKSYGGIFGLFGSVYFPLVKKDTISPASSVALGGMVSTNKTWFTFGAAKLYYREDHWRTVIAGGIGEQNFQYFNENYGVGGSFVAYSTLLRFFYIEQMVKVYGHWYTGLDFTFFRVKTDFENAGEQGNRNYVAVGIPITFDSRDNIQNATAGWFSNMRLNRFDEALGSVSEYTKVDIDASNYRSKEKERVFATKVSISSALGSVPFEAQTVVGGKVLRGYSKGEYRGDQVYSLQAEYRWNFYKKWGSVFFAGVATPVNKNETWNTSLILPGGGAGIRYMMIPDLRLNVGLDAALGKGDYGVYFRIGEAF